MFKVWFKLDGGSGNAPALICESDDAKAVSEFSGPVILEQLVNTGEFGTILEAIRHVRASSNLTLGQEIVFPSGTAINVPPTEDSKPKPVEPHYPKRDIDWRVGFYGERLCDLSISPYSRRFCISINEETARALMPLASRTMDRFTNKGFAVVDMAEDSALILECLDYAWYLHSLRMH